MKKKLFKLITVIFLFTFSCFSITDTVAASKYQSLVQKSKAIYKKNNYQYQPYLQNYKPFGDYLNFSQKKFQLSRMKMDKNNIPMVKYYDSYEYNPVTIAQIALSEHGKYLKTKKQAHLNRFLQLADGLIRLQSSDGALRYNFRYTITHLRKTYQPGWVSSMAQGQALSVYARAYQLTKNVKYLNAGKSAFKFLMKPKSQGGIRTNLRNLGPSYKKYTFFEEYVTTPDNYTLNGYMFTLLGIYDWFNIRLNKDYGQKEANKMFKMGIESLLVVLPKYDLGGFTSYDLSHITYKQKPHVVPLYHSVHIYQLYALYTITKDKRILNYYKKWSSYVS
jgi:heparosan-N-sulfate-glucuronate 5-epimerase